MSAIDLAAAFDDALSYALMQDAHHAGAGLPPLAEQDASQAWRTQRVAVRLAQMIDPGPSATDWKDLMYMAASALVALHEAESVMVHTGEDDYRDPACRLCGLTVGHEPGCRA